MYKPSPSSSIDPVGEIHRPHDTMRPDEERVCLLTTLVAAEDGTPLRSCSEIELESLTRLSTPSTDGQAGGTSVENEKTDTWCDSAAFVSSQGSVTAGWRSCCRLFEAVVSAKNRHGPARQPGRVLRDQVDIKPSCCGVSASFLTHRSTPFTNHLPSSRPASEGGRPGLSEPSYPARNPGSSKRPGSILRRRRHHARGPA